MTLRRTILSLLVLIGLSAPAWAAEPIACNLKALNSAQRDRLYALAGKLGGAIVGREEISNGYALVEDPDRFPVTDLAEWVTLVAKCCPFLDYGIDVRGKGLSVTLRITGEEGTKPFIKEEFRELF